jgi:hypothetical protein
MFDTKHIITLLVAVLAGVALERKFAVGDSIPGISGLTK